MNATPTVKEKLYVHLNKSTNPWTCEIRSEMDDAILASGLSADGYQDHTSSADQIVRAVSSFDAMREALEQAIARIEVANQEGNPIMSAWLPDAKAALALAKGEVRA